MQTEEVGGGEHPRTIYGNGGGPGGRCENKTGSHGSVPRETIMTVRAASSQGKGTSTPEWSWDTDKEPPNGRMETQEWRLEKHQDYGLMFGEVVHRCDSQREKTGRSWWAAGTGRKPKLLHCKEGRTGEAH